MTPPTPMGRRNRQGYTLVHDLITLRIAFSPSPILVAGSQCHGSNPHPGQGKTKAGSKTPLKPCKPWAVQPNPKQAQAYVDHPSPIAACETAIIDPMRQSSASETSICQ